MDLSCVDVGHGGAESVTFIVGDALGDALMRPGGVVMRLVFGQDRVQIPAAEDQHPVQDLSAQGAGEALAGRAARKISQTVDGATVTPSLVSSPWIRRCPHSGFSCARRTMSRATPGTVGGRPGLRRLLVAYFFTASLRCQARSVAGVTGRLRPSACEV